ncbi:MAG: ABC transporter substrate-binding protein [Candidatus Binatus sp.]|uniref:MlaC/ttg2D family ABC transporter substrate-binding protein n=1 Tax=Candidatus Binatus sp. TaxID=2811406 RepID=UPI002726DD40|nr:ABC transporter substrate-binding protein [Candidatus Binatus sp.]MDO8433292.1 ABC transporter substrate-binding protein [Candidatus Binatus sp.]
MICRFFGNPRALASTSFSLLTLILAVVMLCASAQAQPVDSANGATASVKTIIDQTTVVFKDRDISQTDREQKLRAIAESHFDFAEMARSAIGYHWRNFTPDQKAEFVPLFTKFIEDIYLSRIEKYSVEKIDQTIKSASIQFTNERADGSDYAEVFSTVALQDRKDPLQVNYLMRRDGNQWKIYDLTIQAISVIANYRNQFNRVLNSGGYDKLISIMRQKAQALGDSLAK